MHSHAAGGDRSVHGDIERTKRPHTLSEQRIGITIFQ